MNNETEDGFEGLYEFTVFDVVLLCVLYSVIAVLAVVGNILVIFVTLGRLRTRSVTTYFIINLAFADLLTGMFAIPFKFQAALFQKWLLPPSLCKIVPFAESMTLSVSVFTLTASAVHEFRTVFFPKHGRLSANGARWLVFSIWVVAAVVSIPFGIFHEVQTIDGEFACLPIYNNVWWKIYNIYLTIVTYFVPVIIVDSAYILIAIKIWTTTSSLTEELQTINEHSAASVEIGNRKQRRTSHKSSRQLMKMLIIVVAMFTLCWLPYEVYLLLAEISAVNGFYYINILFFFSHWLAMSNSCLNPIIYGLYNDKYNREYKRIFARICSFDFRKHESHAGSQKFETEYTPQSFVNKETSASATTPRYIESFQIRRTENPKSRFLRLGRWRMRSEYVEVLGTEKS